MSNQATLHRHGWAYVAVGIAGIFFGVVALVWPGLSLAVFGLIFGVYVLVDGITHLIAAFGAIRNHTTWWPPLIIAIIDIAAGLFIVAYPGLTAVLFVYVVAFWAITLGLIHAVSGLLAPELSQLAIGVLAIVLGLVLLRNPGRGALAYVVVIGIYAIVRGVLLLAEAARGPEPAR